MPRSGSRKQAAGSKKTRVAKSSTPTVIKPRKIAQPKYKSFQLSKRIRQPKAPIKGAFRLFRASLKRLWANKRVFGGVVAAYLVLTIVFVKGFGVTNDISELKSSLMELFEGSSAQLLTSLTLFSVLLSNSGSTASEVAGAYQSMLLVIVSLALIWALRQTEGGARVTVRDTFYKGLYPLIPFLLVLMVIGLQFIPLLLASFIYGVVIAGGLAVTAIEQGLWIVLLAGMALLSLYMVTSSVFALYIVTLPNVTPMVALRSARDLVRHRRAALMRKLLFLPLALLILAGVIMVPFIILSPVVAEWLFFGLSMLSLAVLHSYMYGLYRELIKDESR